MSSLYISRELKKRYVVVFREMFAVDSDFPYNKDDVTNSKIFIHSRYHDLKVESPIPQVLVTTASYTGGQETLFKNFFRENEATPSTLQSRKQYAKHIYFNMGMEVLSSNKAEGEFLADKVFNFMDHEYTGLWGTPAIGVEMQNIVVGETSPRSQYPQYSYLTPISVQGYFVMTWTMGVPAVSVENGIAVLLEHINITLTSGDIDF